MIYDKEQLNELCNGIDLLEYAEQSHTFKRVGSDSYAALCSKHQDINPSLFITPSKNLWYCHGCGKGGNILNWLMHYEGLRFDDAVKKVEKISGKEIIKIAPCSSMSFYKTLERIKRVNEKPKREVLDSSYLDKFQVIDGQPEEWIAEGITNEMIKKYDIRIDTNGNRIVYPVRDNNGNLIGVKGRTRFKAYKTLGISKYINYQKLGTPDFLQGMYENRENIKAKNTVIIFEGIKSVMKVDAWGYDYGVSAETSRLNDEQIKVIIKLNVGEVVLAFDQDVCWEKALAEGKKLNRFTNVSVIFDKNGLLKEKDSPCDEGREVWEKLYKERIRVV